MNGIHLRLFKYTNLHLIIGNPGGPFGGGVFTTEAAEEAGEVTLVTPGASAQAAASGAGADFMEAGTSS